MQKVLVTGAGGFIGHHLVKRLTLDGYWVRAVDLKRPEFEASPAQEFYLADLRYAENAESLTDGVEQVFHLAADMGGIGYISQTHALLAASNTQMNLNLLEASRKSGVKRFFFSSTACVYPMYRQTASAAEALKEEDAYPADPEEGYGWEKLYMEKLCQYYRQENFLDTRVARFHNVYGPLGVFAGGKEKSPAALCRKVSLAPDGGSIEIWGDGLQTRSYLYIDDCIEGILRIQQSPYSEPLNLGTDRLISINELSDYLIAISGKRLEKRFNPNMPQGVRGRNSDNSRLRSVLLWEPEISLEEGMKRTFAWIDSQCKTEAAAKESCISAPISLP